MVNFDSMRQTIEIKGRAYTALILRYIIGRYGRENIGFLWTIVEPMILCVGVMAIWSVTKGKAEHGVNLVAFVFTGYLPLTLWRHQTSMIYLLRANKGLTQFHYITLFDAVISRLFLEFISVSGSALVVFLILHNVGFLPDVYNWGDVIHGWVLMGALGFGSGLLISSISEWTEVVERFIGPMQYFLLPFCGCFYMVEWLPDYAKEIISYIALVHSYELIRAGFFGPEIPTHTAPLYAWAWALIIMGLGCCTFNAVKDRVGA